MLKFESLPERYQLQLIVDAKTYLKKQLGNDGYKAKWKLCMDLTDHEEAYTNKHLAVLADQFKRKELAQAPKDFIRDPALFPTRGSPAPVTEVVGYKVVAYRLGDLIAWRVVGVPTVAALL